MDPSSQSKESGPPLSHPRFAGLEGAIAGAVRDEFDRRRSSGNGGNGGDYDKRITAIESRLTSIEKTMVTGEILQRELANVRVEIHKIPLETIKWVFGLPTVVAAIAMVVYTIFFKHT